MRMYGGCESGVYIPDSTDECSSCRDLEEKIEKKQDKLTAGDHIVITEENVISAVVSDLEDYYTKEEVDALVAGIDSFKVEVVEELPQEGEANTIYLVPNESGTHDEYLWTESGWEMIGSTDVDLSGYVENNKPAVLSALGYAEHTIKLQLEDDTQKTLTYAGNGWSSR